MSSPQDHRRDRRCPPLLALNLDVLTMILSQVHPIDAMHVAESCRAAYPLALPFFLSDVTIGDFDIRGHPDRDPLTSFCAFMLADVEPRTKLLKSLSILPSAFRFPPPSAPSYRTLYDDGSFVDYSAAVPLALVVRLSVNLRTLRLLDAEPVFTAVPELGRAVAALTRLDHVSFETTHRNTLRVISLMRSRPRHVECRMAKSCDSESDLEDEEDEFEEEYLFDRPRYDPLCPGQDRFAENFTSTLTTLKVTGSAHAITQLEPTAVWTAIKELELDVEWDHPLFDLNTFSDAFPNVRCLILHGFLYSIGQSYTSRLHDPTHWPNLDTVEVDAPLPLSRAIRHLRLPYLVYAPFIQILREFLSASAPVILVCYADVAVLECVAATAPSVRVLQLSLAPALGFPPDTFSTLVCISPILARMRLRAVIYPAAASAPSYDEVTTVTCIAQAAPSVECVGMQRSFGAWPRDLSGCYWFHIARPPQESAPVLRKLTQREADELVPELLALQRE